MTAIILVIIFFSTPVMAYIDPGSGSLIISSIIGFLTAIFFYIKSFFFKIKRFFLKNKNNLKK